MLRVGSRYLLSGKSDWPKTLSVKWDLDKNLSVKWDL